MPLAIELTAARTSAFTSASWPNASTTGSGSLTGGARTALPRQQTLRAVTDWSYDLLFDDERTVFERLACSSAAARWTPPRRCAPTTPSPSVEIGGLVGRLVDKSLVVADGSGRFRLLHSLAQYGRERLDDRGDGDAVRDRHAAYYAGARRASVRRLAHGRAGRPRRGGWRA